MDRVFKGFHNVLPMDQEQVWDEIAPKWNEYKKNRFSDGSPVKDFDLLDGFVDGSEKRILDLGCGSGRNFFKFSGVIYGVDFSR